MKFLASSLLRWFVVAAVFTVWPAAALADSPDKPDPRSRHVIHVSVDGLRADAITRPGAEMLPNLYRFRLEGAYTDNARTDYDYSNTLPNHTSQLTGRGVVGPNGHNWTKNSDPDAGETLHTNKGSYVAGVFDVVHDRGLSTALYASKSKFAIYDQSYDAQNGAEDVTGEDNGRDKIDHFVYNADTEALVEQFVSDMAEKPYRYVFLHLRDPDTAGHLRHWDTSLDSPYMRSVVHIDRLLGRVFEMVESNPALAGNTVIVLTSDHGGGGSWHSHGDADDIRNYTIPFYVWGADVEQGELYGLNQGARQHPGMGRPSYDADIQPIRNADAANLSLAHLGLPAVPGSSVNLAMDLRSGTMPSSLFELAEASLQEGEEDDSTAVVRDRAATVESGAGTH